MGLARCKECKAKVSTAAITCPSCGVPNPTERPPVKATGCGSILVLLLVGGLVWAFINHQSKTPAERQRERIEDQERAAVAATQQAAENQQFAEDFAKASEYVKRHQAGGFITELNPELHKARVNVLTWSVLDVDLKKSVVRSISIYIAGIQGRKSPDFVTIYSNLNDTELASRGMFGGITIKE